MNPSASNAHLVLLGALLLVGAPLVGSELAVLVSHRGQAVHHVEHGVGGGIAADQVGHQGAVVAAPAAVLRAAELLATVTLDDTATAMAVALIARVRVGVAVRVRAVVRVRV